MLNAEDEKYIREYVENSNPNDTGSEAHMLCDLLSEIDLLRKENERVIRWIPVSERLPEDENYYLVWLPDESLEYRCQMAIRDKGNVLANWLPGFYSSDGELLKPSHWAERPAGPEEGK